MMVRAGLLRLGDEAPRAPDRQIDAAQDELPHHARVEGHVDAEDAGEAVVLA
jgi:hypothetical protein